MALPGHTSILQALSPAPILFPHEVSMTDGELLCLALIVLLVTVAASGIRGQRGRNDNR